VCQKEVFMKTHKIRFNNKEELLLALCDEDIIGKKFEEGDKQLFVNPRFYEGVKVTPQELTILLEKALIVNAVGEKTIQFLLDKRLVHEEGVIRIQGVPHAQILKSEVIYPST